MESSGNNPCPYREHKPCSACEGLVLRRSHHVHVVGDARSKPAILCGACYSLICVAAKAVLEACDSIGIGADAGEVSEALRTLRVVVLAQDSLELVF